MPVFDLIREYLDYCDGFSFDAAELLSSEGSEDNANYLYDEDDDDKTESVLTATQKVAKYLKSGQRAEELRQHNKRANMYAEISRDTNDYDAGNQLGQASPKKGRYISQLINDESLDMSPPPRG